MLQSELGQAHIGFIVVYWFKLSLAQLLYAFCSLAVAQLHLA